MNRLQRACQGDPVRWWGGLLEPRMFTEGFNVTIEMCGSEQATWLRIAGGIFRRGKDLDHVLLTFCIPRFEFHIF